MFATFFEWYKDVEFYHYIGYLLCFNKESEYINVLYNQWKVCHNKKAFIDFLKGKIKETLNKSLNCGDKNLLEIRYADDSIGDKTNKNPDKTKCKPILLLHNIQTVINQNKQVESDDKFKYTVFYKFPFKLYKTEAWDVEHIDSNTTNKLNDNFSKLLWLYQYKDKLNQNGFDNYTTLFNCIINKITEGVNTDPSSENDKICLDEDEIKDRIDNFNFSKNESLWNKAVEELSKKNNGQLDDLKKNQIGNFTLLDSSTNRGYGNSIFPRKRLAIMAKDRCLSYKLQLVKEQVEENEYEKKKINNIWHFTEEASNANTISAFIPPVTRNVFMKYYSPHTNSFIRWDEEDFRKYKTDIEDVLKDFLKQDSKE